MLKPIFAAGLAIFLTITASAQTTFSGWTQSISSFRLTPKFSFYFDVQLYSSNQLQHINTTILRPGLSYALTKKLTATLGYALLTNRRTAGALTGYLSENDIWQQLLYVTKLNPTNISATHRLRFEERFIPIPVVSGNSLKRDRFENTYRLRYFIRNIIPLKSGELKKGPFFSLQNEVFFNTGNKTFVNHKFFDQNRFFTGLGYRFADNIDVDLGYMNQYVRTVSGYSRNHIIQLSFYKRLQRRK